MADFAPLHRPALSGARTGSFGAAATNARIALTALPEGHVLQVLASAGAGDIGALMPAAGDGGAHAVRPVGPGQWFIVGDATLSPVEIAAKAAKLAGKASIADQGHGRVRIGLSGEPVEAVFAKGTAVDLDRADFPTGSSAMTLIGHISALVTRTGKDSFELLVLRGFAESLWDELIEMSLEFGIDAKNDT